MLEDGGSKVLQNNVILPQDYLVSKPRRPQLETIFSKSNIT